MRINIYSEYLLRTRIERRSNKLKLKRRAGGVVSQEKSSRQFGIEDSNDDEKGRRSIDANRFRFVVTPCVRTTRGVDKTKQVSNSKRTGHGGVRILA